jgi:hypothetical protein
VSGVRISEIVNTLTAYRNLQAGLVGRADGTSDKSAGTSNGLATDNSGQSDGLDWLTKAGDTADLSGADASQYDDGSGDDSLGAIVESFTRQRQTYSFTLPGIKGVSSPISVTWEVEQAYHVIQFVPAGKTVDTQA